MSEPAFATFSYRTENIGDDLQSLAVENLLAEPLCTVDRDSGAVHCRDGEHHAHHFLVANGWFSNQPENWPPGSGLTPLLVSVHLSTNPDNGLGVDASDWFLRDDLVDYLRQLGPVGARDLATLEVLQARDVPAFFSGCMTLTFPQYEGARMNRTVVSDVPPEFYPVVLPHVPGEVLSVTHRVPTHLSQAERRDRAERLVDQLRTAELVVTTRLHSLLPSLALGTPCVLLDYGQVDRRFSGYLELCEVADLRQGTDEVARALERVQGAPLRRDHVSLVDALRSSVDQWVARSSSGPGAGPGVPGEVWAEGRAATAIAEARSRARQLHDTQGELAAARLQSEQLAAALSAARAQLADCQDGVAAGEAAHAAELAAADRRTADADRQARELAGRGMR